MCCFLKPRICCPYLGKVGLNPRISFGLAGLSRQPVATAFCLCRWKNRNKFALLMDPVSWNYWARQFINTSSCWTVCAYLFQIKSKRVMVILSLSDVARWFFCSFSQSPHWLHVLRQNWSWRLFDPVLRNMAMRRFDKATDSVSTGMLHVSQSAAVLPLMLPLVAWLRDSSWAANKHKLLSLFLIVLMRCCEGATYRVARVNWAMITQSRNAELISSPRALWQQCLVKAQFHIKPDLWNSLTCANIIHT